MEVVLPPVMGKLTSSGDVEATLAGATGAKVNPAPVRVAKVDWSTLTVVIPPVTGAAHSGMESSTGPEMANMAEPRERKEGR